VSTYKKTHASPAELGGRALRGVNVRVVVFGQSVALYVAVSLHNDGFASHRLCGRQTCDRTSTRVGCELPWCTSEKTALHRWYERRTSFIDAHILYVAWRCVNEQNRMCGRHIWHTNRIRTFVARLGLYVA
jgi:hypothetical protein